MVFHFRHHNLVARSERELPGLPGHLADTGVAERVGNQVQPGGGVLGPDELIVSCADERGHRGPGVLEDVRGVHGERVGAAVHSGIALLIKLLFGLHDAERIL